VTGTIVALFHPRHDKWATHFKLEGAAIIPLTPTGRVTAKLLNLNNQERVDEREDLRLLGFYPDMTQGTT
jgi:predicted RNA-binding protein with PUA domain